VTETGVPNIVPGIQEKILPGTEVLTFNEAVEPSQITEGMAVGVSTGLGLTVTVTVLVPVHPAAVPVTV
jgi:hypothetical protein